MSMHTLIAAGVIAVLCGCSAPHPPVPSPPVPSPPVPSPPVPSPPVPSGSESSDLTGCPDPKNCTDPNGTGIYTAEDGKAGIGPSGLLITHFKNNGSGVTFQGRYREGVLWRSLSSPGKVTGAHYQGQNLQVLSLSESSTRSTWMLFTPGSSATIPVVDTQLIDLTLDIEFIASPDGRPERYRLSFTNPNTTTTSNGRPPVSTYNMSWRDVTTPGAPPTPYCFDANGHIDPIVFQKGIDVDPGTGAVERKSRAGFVTMSCSGGALAIVYSWGYPYMNTFPSYTFYFDAGIQMKRASYCGDSKHFTVAGTLIQIADDRALHYEHLQYGDILHLEARWTPYGAICLNPNNKRRPDLNFDGKCKGVALPECTPPATPPPPYLSDGPENLLPLP
jgi:hypothetical protein